MREIFQKWKTPRLRGHLIWIPMVATDDRNAAVAQEALFQDERIIQYWDSERTLGLLVSRGLELSAPVAWDIYLLYSSGTIWKRDQMPIPDFWMHQLNERPDLFLDLARLRAEVQKAIETSS